MSSILRREGGFTLVELMAVAFIIGLLTVMAVPVFLNATVNTKLKTCQGNLRTLDGAIQNYAADKQVYPTSLNDLVPGYVKAVPTDPFGGAYSFVGASSTAPPHAVCSIGHTY